MDHELGMLSLVLLVGCSGCVSADDVGAEIDVTTEAGSESGTDGQTTRTDTQATDQGTGTDATSWQPDVDTGAPEPVSCDPFVQDCVDGEKCVAYGELDVGWIGYRCVPVLGDKGPGEPCTYDGFEAATDDCDATSACFEPFNGVEPFMGICTPLCGGTADRPWCEPGFACFLAQSVTQTVCIPV